MKKVIVIGSPGAGKSVFSKALSECTELPLYHLDLIWHKPDKTNISRDEFDQALANIMQGDTWIIDGNYMRTVEMRLQRCDTVFLLDYPIEVCLEGVTARIGKARPDMPWIETEFDAEFENFIKGFPNIQLPKIYSLLKKYSDKVNVIIFKSRDEANKYLEDNCVYIEKPKTAEYTRV